MGASKYTAEKPLWSVRVVVPTTASFEYNYFRIEVDGKTITKESEPKRTFAKEGGGSGNEAAAAGGSCLEKAVVNDVWR